MTGQTNLGSWRRSSSAIRHRHVNFLATTLVILIKQATRLCSQTETKEIIMTRKLLMIGITLVGLTMAFGSNAWAENGRSGKDRRNDKAYHQNYKTPSGHHYGWEKGKKNPHKDSYQHRPEYRDRDNRWDINRHYRDRYHRGYHHQRPVVEKHVYHHYSTNERYDDDSFNVAFSVIDQVFSVALAANGTR